MAYAKPAIKFVYPLVSLEQFGYGVGFTAFTVYLMYVCKGENKTSHFAISTGLMALGLMIPGAISGQIQQSLGYPLFFVLVCLATIPGMLTIFFIPLAEDVK
jgi:PAT family beta-lactamase induction signal transducer AmpG